MPKLKFDAQGERFFETGVSQGVLFVMSDTTPGTYEKGVAWNGLSAVTESPTGAEASPIYADNIKYLNLMSVEEFEATIEAYTYPDEFGVCDGSATIAKGASAKQQKRRQFAFCYQTKLGNDVDADLGFKIHIIYGALASPTEKAYETVNDSPDAITFSWSITTTPVAVTGFKPTALIEIDSTKADPDKLKTLMDKLYGTDQPAEDSTLPTPDEIIAILGSEVAAG